MLPVNFVIQGVQVWHSTRNGGCRKGLWDVEVLHGKVHKIAMHGQLTDQPSDVFPGRGLVLMPAGVDVQTHLRTPGQLEKETPDTGLRAALRGGYGAVLSMPNTKPVIDSVDVALQAQELVRSAEQKTGVRAFFTAAITQGQQGTQPVNAKALKDAGVLALTDDGVGVARDDVMLEALKLCADADLPLLQHAETPGHGGVLAPGPTQQKLGLQPYPESAEISMLARDLRLHSQVPSARYHLLHATCAKAIALIQSAPGRSFGRITCEVSPHHLYYCADDIPPNNTSFKMNPPLRSAQDRLALRLALIGGQVDFVSTDHAPHEKTRKGEDFSSAAFGTTGLETTHRVLSQMYAAGELSGERLVEVFSAKPAEFLGISDQIGRIYEGFPVNFVLWDPLAAARPLTADDLESLSKNNCFLGADLPGKIEAVFNSSGVFRF